MIQAEEKTVQSLNLEALKDVSEETEWSGDQVQGNSRLIGQL